jgi:hypothetical protein
MGWKGWKPEKKKNEIKVQFLLVLLILDFMERRF